MRRPLTRDQQGRSHQPQRCQPAHHTTPQQTQLMISAHVCLPLHLSAAWPLTGCFKFVGSAMAAQRRNLEQQCGAAAPRRTTHDSNQTNNVR